MSARPGRNCEPALLTARLNADFSRRAAVRTASGDWVPSPVPGVSRLLLDRVGEEVARATSLVRYAPNSRFPEHVHGGGEEIFVLEGEFADEHGRYAAGSYLRNPIGSAHSPSVGSGGALLFVKLRQFHRKDQRQCVIDTRESAWLPGAVPGLQVMFLHEFRGEQVRLLKLAPGAGLEVGRNLDGEELFVLDGEIQDAQEHYDKGSWLRWPAGDPHSYRAGGQGAVLLDKTGHLGPAMIGRPG